MKLTNNIHQLKLDFTISISPEQKITRFVNSIIIFGDKITLIDTGTKGSEEKIFSYIEQNKRDISEIETIIFSHSHPDHIGSAAKIKELTGCKVLAHEAEVNWIENIETQNKTRPVPGFFNLVDRSVKVDGTLHNGQIIQINKDTSLEIIHAPGHSDGSVNLFFREDKILFTADSIPLKNDIPNYSNYQELMASLQKIKQDGRYTTLLSSWTPPLFNMHDIKKLIEEGEEYMLKIDNFVQNIYLKQEANPLTNCAKVVDRLELTPFIVMPIIDRAFRSHFA